jgi:hypothetical protein
VQPDLVLGSVDCWTTMPALANRLANLTATSLAKMSNLASMTSSSLLVVRWTTKRCRKHTPCDTTVA